MMRKEKSRCGKSASNRQHRTRRDIQRRLAKARRREALHDAYIELVNDLAPQLFITFNFGYGIKSPAAKKEDEGLLKSYPTQGSWSTVEPLTH